ncbi:hypothetical protein LTR62_000751 [Meristemomyces frigidus]|uniref:FHA domain-containing protein n=1 Tax=Meristemomyces frigidus TaxID=1508187 RepID=A0AAN7T8Y3_9PEZI|nr:hypothetical protein LTR62_000751 [Meristemomyces frigidus]
MFQSFSRRFPDAMSAFPSLQSPPVTHNRHELVTISLTPSDERTDRRALTVAPGSTLIIGRASTTGGKNLTASSGNALFSRPVVSRVHAEIRAYPHKPKNEQVTITDSDSTHGTYVNNVRLAPHTPFCLRSGDEIKLGDRVSRGLEIHNPVTLLYKRIDDTNELTPAKLSAVKGFHVPSDSEEESEEESRSVISVVKPTSSAKTAPYTTKLGSAQKPIDLDKPNHVSQIITLDDDDEAAQAVKPTVKYRTVTNRSEAPSDSQKAKETARAASIELGEARSLVVKDTYDSGEEDVERCRRHFDDKVERKSLGEESRQHHNDERLVEGKDDHSSQDSDEDDDDQDFPEDDYPSYDEHESDVDSNFDYDRSVDAEENGAAQDDTFHQHFPPTEPSNTSVIKETLLVGHSVTPRYPEVPMTHTLAQNSQTTCGLSSFQSQASYDPVRNMQLPQPAPLRTSTYTYERLNDYSVPRNTTTDFQDSSRWDIGPPAPVLPMTGTNCYPSTSHPQSFYTAPLQESAPLLFQIPTQPPISRSCDWTFPPYTADNGVIPQVVFGASASATQSSSTAVQVGSGRASLKRMSFPDVVQHQDDHMQPKRPSVNDASNDACDLAIAAQAQAAATMSSFQTSKGSSKRKAAEMSDLDNAVDAIDAVLAADKTLVSSGPKKTVPPPSDLTPAERAADLMAIFTPACEVPRKVKRARTTVRRTTTAADVAKAVGKYAAAAGVGATGMVAFLASPYAGRVLEWMG